MADQEPGVDAEEGVVEVGSHESEVLSLKSLANLLFICSKNQWRSPTAELLFKNHPVHQARSAGTSDKARVKISQKLIDWANVIFFMEKRHRDIVRGRFQIGNQQLIVLDIADDYQFGDGELIAILKEVLADYLA